MFCLIASSLVLPVEVGGAWAAIVRDMGGVEMGGGGGDVDGKVGRWREAAQRVNVKGVSQKCFRRILVLSEAGALGRARRSHPIRGRPRAADRSIGENQDAWHFRLPVVRRATFTCIQTSRHLVTVNTEK